MKTAHWARVTAAIRARRPDFTWVEAKRAYDRMRDQAGRAPSLRMVKAAPTIRRPPRVAPVQVKPSKAPTAPPPRKPWYTEPPPPAAPPPKARDREVTGERPRSRFEKMLTSEGLSLGLARNASGHVIAGMWRKPELQREVVTILKQIRNNIRDYGYVPPPVRDILEKIMSKVWINSNTDIEIKSLYWQFLRESYGSPEHSE